MRFFDFKIDTKDIDINEFNNAVDFLHYIDARSNWSFGGYDINNKPATFNEQKLTNKEFCEWLKAVFIFVERCCDYYKPSDIAYSNFDAAHLIEHYLEIYIIISFLNNQESCLFFYENYGFCDMQKNLTDYVNSSSVIQNFLNVYGKTISIDKEKYKDYGRYLGEDDFLLDCFPFKNVRVNFCEKGFEFSAMLYILKNGELYKLSKRLIDDKYFQEYFNVNQEYKNEFHEITSAVNENRALVEEYEDKIILLYDEYDKSSDINAINGLKDEIIKTEKMIKKLSGIEDLKKMILKHSDILPYEIIE